MRTDLEMTKGKMIAQGAHASLKVIVDRMFTDGRGSVKIGMTEEMDDWIFGDSFTKICVRVESEKELDDIFARAQKAGIVSALIIDSGKKCFMVYTQKPAVQLDQTILAK